MNRVAQIELERRNDALARAQLNEDIDQATDELTEAISDYYENHARIMAGNSDARHGTPYLNRILRVVQVRYINRGNPIPVDLAARLMELGIEVENL